MPAVADRVHPHLQAGGVPGVEELGQLVVLVVGGAVARRRRRTGASRAAVRAPIEPSTGRSPPTAAKPWSITRGRSIVATMGTASTGQARAMAEEDLQVAHPARCGASASRGRW